MTNHRGAAATHPRVNSPRLGCVWGFIAMLAFTALPSLAQDDDPQVQIIPVALKVAQATQPEKLTQDSQSRDQQAASNDAKLTVPAGTKLSLALARSISFKHTKPGDDVNLQFVFPVVVNNRMVIPPGTYMQGVIEEITRHDRKYEVVAMRLRSANVIFATGYTVSVAGPLDVNPTYGKLAAPDSPHGKDVPVMAATAPAPPPLPPLPHLGPSPGEITAIALGSAAAVIVTGTILYHNRDFLMEAGTPVEINLSSPLVLDESNVTAAVQQFSKAPPEIVKPARRMRTCWTPGTSDYPSTPYPCTY